MASERYEQEAEFDGGGAGEESDRQSGENDGIMGVRSDAKRLTKIWQ